MIRRFIEGLYLTKREKVGYSIAMMLVILTIIIRQFLPFFVPQQSTFTEAELLELRKKKAQDFLQKKPKKKNLFLFDFDPNTVTLDQLDSMNLPEFFSNNLIRYIESGGRISKPKDLEKIYGITDTLFYEMLPYIKIVFEEEKNNIQPQNLTSNNFKDKKENVAEIKATRKNPNFKIKINQDNKEKLIEFGFSNFAINNLLKYRAKGGVVLTKEELLSIYGIDSLLVSKHLHLIDFSVVVNEINFELNAATIEELDQIPGIGKTFATRIINYREKLGGYCSLNQLNEIYGLQEFDFSPYQKMILIDTQKIKKIEINKVEFSELLKHPYFEYADVKSIFYLRNEFGFLDRTIIETQAILNPKYKSYYLHYIDF